MTKPRIVILAGAGASYAVDSELYPMAAGFYSRLSIDDSLLRTIESALRYAGRIQETPDVEQILWALDEISSPFSQLTNDEGLVGQMIHRNEIGGLFARAEPVFQWESVRKTSTQFLFQIRHLRDAINEKIFTTFDKAPQFAGISTNWFPLLSELQRWECRVDIFTTNYDRVIEFTIDKLGRLRTFAWQTGRRQYLDSQLDFELWKPGAGQRPAPIEEMSQGTLTKLHGSVDWRVEGDFIYYGNPHFSGDHSRQKIIYPGFKGKPTDRTFQWFHEYFSNCLSSASAVLIIGSACRDEFLNEILRNRTKQEALKLVVNPRNDTPPWDERSGSPVPVREGFGPEAVDVVLSTVKSVVSSPQA